MKEKEKTITKKTREYTLPYVMTIYFIDKFFAFISRVVDADQSRRIIASLNFAETKNDEIYRTYRSFPRLFIEGDNPKYHL